MKTYFNYHENIASIDMAQAIASPLALGPFAGFSSAKITELAGKTPTIQINSIPNVSEKGSTYYNEYLDKVNRRYLSRVNIDSNTGYIKFGCIARDGTIHTSTSDSITLNITGTKGSLNEVLLFACHTPLTEDVANPLVFVALWNESSTSFYEIYKKSIDATYGNSTGEYGDPYVEDEMNYTWLDNVLKTNCSSYVTNYSSWIFIGAYGSGTNADTGLTENFALVPYLNEFPCNLPYNTRMHSKIVNQLTTLKQTIDESFRGEFGMIKMWAGITVPDGYCLCNGVEYDKNTYPSLYNAIGDTFNNARSWDGNTYTTSTGKFRVPDLRGRFVVGMSDINGDIIGDYNAIASTGGEAYHELTLEEIPPHTHPYYDHYMTGSGEWNDNGGEDQFIDEKRTTESTGGKNGKTVAHENRPPFYALAYIMRLY